jgi:hypothetical protein
LHYLPAAQITVLRRHARSDGVVVAKINAVNTITIAVITIIVVAVVVVVVAVVAESEDELDLEGARLLRRIRQCIRLSCVMVERFRGSVMVRVRVRVKCLLRGIRQRVCLSCNVSMSNALVY